MKPTPFNPTNFLILIVDDITQNIGLLVDILESVGYSTTFAKNGKQALERVELANPDLILLDLMMPEMDGIEVCKILKSDPQYSHIPIIFLTASSEDSHLIEAFEKGAVDYVTKPFKIPELLARVKTHLDLKRTQDELKKAYAEMEKLATTDPLTNINNRRSILACGEQEFERYQRYKCQFSVIILDIDHFKKVNDNYGHDVGDKVLVKVAHLLQKSIRIVDQIGRFGGEEFLIILPKSSLKDAILVAERLRKSVEQLSFNTSDPSFKVTISLGVDSCQATDENIDQIIKRADQALFVAKDNGRNQVYSLKELNEVKNEVV
jgi:diguanylate cyclase (GGDEF)-like protein